MPAPHSLQLSTADSDAPLTPQQKRFNSLVKQIGDTRANLALWRESIAEYQRAYAKEVTPLIDALASEHKAWAFALDELSDLPGWSRAELALLSDLISAAACELLLEKDDDAELKELYGRHSDVDFETARQNDLQETLEQMKEMTGVDLGEVADAKSDDDLADRLHEKLRERDAAEQARNAGKEERRRKSAATLRREAEEQQATQSVRDIFRRLASALHPDRESDPRKREEKTILMQQANQAYAANDLLTLLQLQLQVAQVDAAHIVNAGAEKLQHYNKALAEQLAELKLELGRLQSGFCMDAGLRPNTLLNPAKLGDLIKYTKRGLREDLAQVQQELRMLADPASARRWLKRYRQAR